MPDSFVNILAAPFIKHYEFPPLFRDSHKLCRSTASHPHSFIDVTTCYKFSRHFLNFLKFILKEYVCGSQSELTYSRTGAHQSFQCHPFYVLWTMKPTSNIQESQGPISLLANIADVFSISLVKIMQRFLIAGSESEQVGKEPND